MEEFPEFEMIQILDEIISNPAVREEHKELMLEFRREHTDAINLTKLSIYLRRQTIIACTYCSTHTSLARVAS
ncbi:hypothetical protein O181_009795 [Austropuccinia psidii MF-1]|uniref:Uncharacterized protein n=1 Tax=Austropuccinia psidii MF-1 TaxID=1389203 RepID=A0A9Q3GK93_9BASI|nr:hypothetical protein [Austropuccinia psidii MF-1]